MALVVKDRIKVTAAAPGTGNVTLGSAELGYQTFAAIGNNNSTYYAIQDLANNLWEVGEGVFTTSGPTLTRSQVLSNSAGNTSAINFTNAVEVFVTTPATKSVHMNLTDDLEINGDVTFTSDNATDQVLIKNTNTGTSAAPDLVLWRDSSQVANADSIGRIDFRGEDDGSTARNYTSIESKIVNVAASTPTGAIHFKTLNASTSEADVLVLSGNAATFAGGVDAATFFRAPNFYTGVGSQGLVNTNTNDLKLVSQSGDTHIYMDNDLAVELYHNNAKKLETTSSGIDVTGGIVADHHVNIGTGMSYQWGDSHERIEQSDGVIEFFTGNNEKMRLQGSTLLVGSTTAIDTTLSGGTPALQVVGSGFSAIQSTTRRDSGAYGPAVILAKSKNATVGSYTAVVDNDSLGSIIFIGDDGTDLDTYGATIGAEVNGTPGSNDMPADLVFSTNGGTSTVTERLRIHSDGNIGVGTSSPDQKMHLYTSSGTTLYKAEVNSNSTIGLEIKKTGSTTQTWRIVDGETVNGALQFYDVTDSRLGMQLDGSGNFMVGTTDTSLYNNTSGGGLVYRPGNELTIAAETNPQLIVNLTGNDGEMIRFVDDGSTVGYIGLESGSIHIGGGDVGIGFYQSADALVPLNPASGALRSDQIDLGLASGGRYKDVHCQGMYVGATNTSYDLYNNGTTYLNGAVTVDNFLTVSGTGAGVSIDGGTSNNGTDATLYVTATNNNDWGLIVNKSNGSATEYGQDIRVSSGANYAFRVVGGGVERFRINGTGQVYSQSSIYATQYHDLSNNNFYLASAGTSNINVIQFSGQANCTINQYSNDLTLRSHDDMNLKSRWIRMYSGPGSTTSTSGTTEYARISDTGNWFTGPMSFGGNNSGSSFGSNSNPGTSGQVLTSQGNATAPTWADAGGSGWEHVTTYEGNGSDLYWEITVERGYYYKVYFWDVQINNGGSRNWNFRFNNYTNGLQKDHNNNYITGQGWAGWHYTGGNNQASYNGSAERDADNSSGSTGWYSISGMGDTGSGYGASYGNFEYYQPARLGSSGGTNNPIFKIEFTNNFRREFGIQKLQVDGTSGSSTDATFINKIRVETLQYINSGFYGKFRIMRLKDI